MTTISENQNDDDYNFITFVESLDTSDMPVMLASRILPSFLNSMHVHGLKCFSQLALYYWEAEMMAHYLKPTTMKRYLGALHSLFRQWEELHPGMESPDFATPDLSYSDESAAQIKRTTANLTKLTRLSGLNKTPFTSEYTHLNALLYLLIDPTISLPELVDLKFSDSQIDSHHIEDIKLAMRNAPQAQYVFPLEQGKRRKPAILHDLLRGIRKVALPAGIEFGNSFSRDSITSLWIAMAIQQGIEFGKIRAIISNLPEPYLFLTLIPAQPMSEAEKTDILNRVAASFINNSTSWYVMRLRAGVTPEAIKDQLRIKKYPLLKQVEFYFPLKTVKKISKKKAVEKKIPILPGILFFRMRHDKISRMMSLIGDLAWCYRTGNSPYCEYSAIPQKEMRIFQRSIGYLTSDVEMEIIASQPPINVGDKVVIENGTPLDGMKGVIRKVRKKDGTLSYTLRLSDSEFIHWNEVTLPATSITKIQNQV